MTWNRAWVVGEHGGATKLSETAHVDLTGDEVPAGQRVFIGGSRSLDDLRPVAGRIYLLPEGTVVMTSPTVGACAAVRCAACEQRMLLEVWTARRELFASDETAYFARDEELIRAADSVILFWDGQSRGTAHELNYARELGKPLQLELAERQGFKSDPCPLELRVLRGGLVDNAPFPAPAERTAAGRASGVKASQLVQLPIDSIAPCPIQPRVNFSVELIRKLSASIKAGRHDPLLEVEPRPGKTDRYQIVCGEQRWRAAKEAGLKEVLVRLHAPLGYLERLEKQYEENRLRSDLDPIEEAHCCLLDKTLRDIEVAERLLREALVPFQPLADRRVADREQFARHLEALKQLLVRRKVHTIRTAEGRLACGPLARWRETEGALGISETARKRMLAILRLDPELQEAGRQLPAEHLVQISRLPSADLQAELIARAPELAHHEVHELVDRLLKGPNNEQLAAPEDAAELAFEARLQQLADLCRQLVRSLGNLGRGLSPDDRARVRPVIAALRPALDAFGEEAP